VRWAGVAAAVVVSFVVGQMAERRWPEPPGRQAAPAVSATPGDAAPVRVSLTDDEVFGQIELAAVGVPEALQPLDALTPRAWDVR
jgi:hypothetical protein